MRMGVDPKQKKWNILQWQRQSPDWNPGEHAFHLLKIKIKNKQELKTTGVEAWQIIPREETQQLGTPTALFIPGINMCPGWSTCPDDPITKTTLVGGAGHIWPHSVNNVSANVSWAIVTGHV